MGDDCRSCPPESQVAAHLLPVPVRVEDSCDTARARQPAQPRKHRVGGPGSAAVHQHLTGACRPHQDVTRRAGEHHETIGHRDDREAFLRESIARETRQGQTDGAA